MGRLGTLYLALMAACSGCNTRLLEPGPWDVDMAQATDASPAAPDLVSAAQDLAQPFDFAQLADLAPLHDLASLWPGKEQCWDNYPHADQIKICIETHDYECMLVKPNYGWWTDGGYDPNLRGPIPCFAYFPNAQQDASFPQKWFYFLATDCNDCPQAPPM